MKRLITTISIAIITFIIFAVSTYTSGPTVSFMAKASISSLGQVFWKEGAENFSQKRSKPFRLNKGIYRYSIALPENAEDIVSLRIDPGNKPKNNVQFYYFLIEKSGYDPIYIPFQKIKSVKGIKATSLTSTYNIFSSNKDPILRFTMPKLDFTLDWGLLLIYVLVSLIAGAFIYFSWGLFTTTRFSLSQTVIASGFLIVFGLSFMLAIKAKFNASPDERDHFLAADFFKANTDTPHRREQVSAYTYNYIWAYSRVYQDGIHYQLAGKFSNLFDDVAHSHQSVRFLGAFLLLGLGIVAYRFSKANIILLPLLLTPQIWYLFSYINDAYFALFLSFLIAILTEAGRKHLLDFKWKLKPLIIASLIGICFGIIYISKDNYRVFMLYYLAYLLFMPYSFDKGIKEGITSYIKSLKSFIKVPALVILVALVTVGARKIAVSVGDHSQTLATETVKHYERIDNKKKDFFKKDRTGQRFGSYSDMMKKWIPTSYESFNGRYGYMRYGNTKGIQSTFLYLHLLLLGFLLYFVAFKSSNEVKFWSVTTLLAVFAMIFASSYIFSYNYNYQPQGRYLFPILPIIGLFLYKLKPHINKYALGIPSILLFMVSIYSFVFVAFKHI